MNADRDQDPTGGAQGAVRRTTSPPSSRRCGLRSRRPRRTVIALLRAVAEVDNVRKRAPRDIEAAGRFGAERLAADLLEVRTASSSASRRAQGPMPPGSSKAWRRRCGCCDKAFERAGVTVVDPQGQPFNPELHEAMATQESRRVPAGHGPRGRPEGLHAQRPAAAAGASDRVARPPTRRTDGYPA